MKRSALIRHLRRHGCQMVREGRSHSIWINTGNGRRQTIPRHAEIKNQLARRICRQLGLPEIGK
ncbi:MAG: type II toxin-antitoxin system HicA family toxin [Dehalococcoidia bacterium]|nr:type II toxin-antitoxin system HicA family toxin [Dehalococcoidia bacterium]MDP7084439.1 type II toxin-antitoxin system HicA family toxin [Dehalococcoidia bacterium]MDP7200043.1 type II toxin-antitoxin system HicA family toxin [Dehalococcoidia bacterium]MDP7512075.1 type II toxin-antitoxin system HicA family toxin [Dehalococcoidia bacterium]HJN86273.1 type II toxin-antitoxin system HicA family toxin [Dehalococcoidia bacterium]